MKSSFVVTGTDTGVGKTVFSAALAGFLGANYWKPIQSGLDEETDSAVVTRLSGLSPERVFPEAYRLRTPVSPHLSAELDGLEINRSLLVPPDCDQPLIIEGAGGLMVPLNREALFVDLFAEWKIPVILCARTSLGTINHTLLSIEAIRRRQIPLCGIAFIGNENVDTQATIARMGAVKILGRLPWLSTLTKEHVHRSFSENFEISDILDARP